MLHRYKAQDIQKCLQDQQIIYAGDSSIRQLFWATARKVDPDGAYQEKHLAQKHGDLSFEKDGINLEFIWDPYLNTSALQAQLQSTAVSMPSDPNKTTTAIVLIGGGLWHARYLDEDYLQDFEQAIEDVTSFTNQRHIHIPLKTGALRILAPIQVPWYDSLSEERRETITPARVKAMNEHLLQLSLQRGIPIAWAFSLMSYQQQRAYDVSGLHVVEDVAERMVDVLLNMRCNTILMERQSYPMDKTCCAAYPKMQWTQTLLLWWLMELGILLVLNPCRVRGLSSRIAAFLPPRRVMNAMGILSTTLCYCYYADRTQLWNKAQKQFEYREFTALYTAAAVVGLLSIRGTKPLQSSEKILSPTKTVEQAFLSRDQTDEWKGWMQILILVYHYTGGSRILPIYEIVRLLVASYLYMTGFGHAIFFAKKADYSLRRSTFVLLRLNLLSVLLSFVMNTDYLFYYFAPLTSCWYIITYLTMCVKHQRNHSLGFVIAKIFVSAAVVNTLIRSRRLFEDLFKILERCCAIHWNLSEWRFRLQLDSYIVFIGMLSGIMFIRIKEVRQSNNDDDFDRFSTLVRKHFPKLRFATLISALVSIPAFYLFARHANNKYAYNAYVPYLSTYPILSFVILRNYLSTLRNFHSTAFAWIGKISLETFTLQFHIWLAADTKGLLSTGLLTQWGGRYAEFVVLSIIFLWISKHVSTATQTITNWIVDPSAIKEDNDDKEDLQLEEVRSRMKCKEDLNYTMRVVNDVGAGAVRSASGVKSLVSRDLRVRLVIIVLILWSWNMVSPCYYSLLYDPAKQLEDILRYYKRGIGIRIGITGLQKIAQLLTFSRSKYIVNSGVYHERL